MRRILALVVLLHPAAAAAESAAILDRLIAGMERAGYEIDIGARRVEGTMAVLESITLRHPSAAPGYELAIGRVSLDGADVSDDVALRWDALSIENAVARGEKADSQMDRLSISDLQTPPLAGLGFRREDRARSVFDMLHAFAGSSYEAIELDGLSVSPKAGRDGEDGVPAAIAVESLRAGPQSDGIMRSLEAGPMRVVVTRDHGQTIHRLERVTAGAQDIGSLLDVMTSSPSGTSNREWREIGESANYANYSVEGPSGEGRIARITLGGLEARSPDVPLLDTWTRFVEAEVEPGPLLTLDFFAGVAGAIKVEDLAIDGLSATGGRGERAGTAALEHLGIEALSYPEGFRNLSLAGLHLVNPKAAMDEVREFRLDAYEMQRLDLPEKASFSALHEKEPGWIALLNVLPRSYDSHAAGIAMSYGEGATITLEETATEASGFLGGLPTQVESTMRSLRLPVAMFHRPARETLRAMRYDILDLSSVYGWTYDGDAGTFLSNLRLSLQDGFDTRASLVVSNVPDIDQETLKGDLLLLQFAGASLREATLTLTDRSIVSRALEMAASFQNITVGELRERIISALPQVLDGWGSAAFQAQAGDALAAFLRSPGTLTFKLAPSTPVPLVSFAAGEPASILPLLNPSLDMVEEQP